MKIKVTLEKIYNSDNFYAFSDEEDLEITFEDFKVELIRDLQDYPEEIIDDLKFEELKE